MKTIELNNLIEILQRWIYEPASRKLLAAEFEDLVGNYEISGVTKLQDECLGDLCNDFAYYTQNPEHAKEDSALKDDKEMENEVKAALSRLIVV